MSRVSGITLDTLAETIPSALQAYSEVSDGAVVFDIHAAAQLELTPDKPNSARSATPVHHLGEVAGTLYVIVFDSKDGTGDENTFKLQDSMLGGSYPLESKLVPRSKAGFHSEAHLAIAAFWPTADPDPILFGNHLDMVSLKDGRMKRLAYLGQDLHDFTQASSGNMTLGPTATLTTGYDSETGERFGDPHSVYNYQPFVQIAGFLAITDSEAARHASSLTLLGARQPELLF